MDNKVEETLYSMLLTYNVVVCIFESLNNFRVADFILYHSR